jgi:hypothetical protein
VPAFLGTIASLPIPSAGSYVIVAKAILHDDVSTSVFAECQLFAGGDYDFAEAGLNGTTPSWLNYATVALNVVHQYTAAGTADLKCDGFGVATDASWIKITAIRVGTLTNTGL